MLKGKPRICLASEGGEGMFVSEIIGENSRPQMDGYILFIFFSDYEKCWDNLMLICSH